MGTQMGKGHITVTVRLGREEAAMLDQMVGLHRLDRPELEVTRSSMVRWAIRCQHARYLGTDDPPKAG